MLKRLTEKEQIGILLDTYSAAVRQAFLEAIADIRSRVTLKVIVEKLEKGDILGAIDAVNLERSAFNKVLDQIAAAFNAGGTAAVDALPTLRDPQGHKVVVRFDYRNPDAEAWLRDHSSTLVTRIVDDQRQVIRTALTEGLMQGQNPRTTALNVIGRTNRATGRREGGVIGLTSAQERAAARAREELASGEPDQLRAYLQRQRRDRRFDKMITAAIRDGKRLDNGTVEKIIGRYTDRLLDLRGETLACTETMTALGQSRDMAIRQQIASGKIDAQDVTKEWVSAGDNRVRHTHRVLDHQRVGIDGVFHSSSGAVLRFPGDPNAPTNEIVGCRCTVTYHVDRIGRLARKMGRQ